jgi:hypothetical protein
MVLSTYFAGHRPLRPNLELGLTCAYNYHGRIVYLTRGERLAGFGALDVAAGIASLFPPADFITGPYFSVRLGMGFVEVANFAAQPSETSSP